MSVTSETYLVGLVGDGVTPSLTPPLHEAEAAAHGMQYLYRPIDLGRTRFGAEDIADILHAARDFGFNALNITHPCKQTVLAALDHIDPTAAALDAVNTVLITEDGFVGHNTDFSGFSSALRTEMPDADLSRVVLLGSGGAGSAVGYAVLNEGAEELVIIDLERERAEARAAALQRLFPGASVRGESLDAVVDSVAQASGCVQATPIGMHNHPGMPYPREVLRPDLWVAEVIYRPVETELVQAARAAGAQVLDGGHMAVGQAADAFELITGSTADRARMRAHFLELLNSGR